MYMSCNLHGSTLRDLATRPETTFLHYGRESVVHLLENLNVDGQTGVAIVRDWVQRKPRQRVVALKDISERKGENH